ncbi:MAG: GNAT family N-acetyltransferase [Methylacidiphilales bacterium]|nr:GNAT family N-acetyltransferase [Candidatus Methylacidiphilales bacterium]
MRPIEKLLPTHETDSFDCGKEPLNCFLKRFALLNQRNGSSMTYVACRGLRVVGYYSLAVGSVMFETAPQRVSKGLPRHPVPVMLLARLAVDRSEQRTGIGKGLLKDALLRTVQAADIAGIRALLVHAKDEGARAWYLKYDFEPGPTDPLHLFLLPKDVRANS